MTDPASSNSVAYKQARETLDVAYEIAKILNTGLDRETVSIIIGLCENGANPQALAAVVEELRREGAALEAASTQS